MRSSQPRATVRFRYPGERLRLKHRATNLLDREREHVADAALGLNDLRRARIGLEFAPQPQDLYIDAAIENVFVHTRCLQQLFAADGPLGRVEKGGQQGIFAFGQRDPGPAGVGEPPVARIELPAAETVSTALHIPWGRGTSGLLPAQNGANSRQKLPEAERLGDIVIGPQLQSDHPVDFITSVTSGDNHRNIGTSSHLAQQVEPIILVEPQIENHQVRLSGSE